MWGCGLCQTLVSYQGYLCCVCHNHSQKGNILCALCLVICRPTKSICMTCFDAPGDPDVVTIVSICPIVTRIDQSVVIFTPHMSPVVSPNIAWLGCRGQGSQ